MSGTVGGNPFLGPQPYRAADRERFFGREQVTQRLANRLLAHPCLTLFGPSGAGKSSVMQAGVIPLLEETHDFRTVRIDGWLAGEAPLERLVRALHTELELGPVSGDAGSLGALDAALELAVQRSERPVLIYLDQLEQLFLPGRDANAASELFKGLDVLARKPVRGLQLVLAMREDYLGRFRDRVRGKRELLAQGFRLGPLTVGEMMKVACRLAGEQGTPAQPWSEDEVRKLMRQVRILGQEESDEAEVQAAFAQIVCRALWDERAQGKMKGPVSAEPMLHRYLEATLDALGPLKGAARQFLEEHLIASDGSRTLLMERQARAELPEGKADAVLRHLEAAAVLHAEEHQGSRYFELGHDWLARKVVELKQERMQRKSGRKLLDIAAAAVAFAALMAGALLMALGQRTAAEQAKLGAEKAQQDAVTQAERARGLALIAGARDLEGRGYIAMATKLLLEVPEPAQARWWTQLAVDFLKQGAPVLTLQGTAPVRLASFSQDGQWVLTASEDGTAQVWRADGTGRPVVLKGAETPLSSAEFSPDGRWVVTASEDGLAWVWRADGTGTPVVLKGHEGSIFSADFSPDGHSVVTAALDGTARVWKADGTGAPVVLKGHEGSVRSVRFSPDGRFVVTTSFDQTARVWRADGTGRPVVLKGHKGVVRSARFSADGQWVVTASEDGTARVWRADGTGLPVVLKGHESTVVSAEFSPDGKQVVTASIDHTARVWPADGTSAPWVLQGHEGTVYSARFSPDGRRVLTASADGTVRMWRRHSFSVLKGHKGAVHSARFSADGQWVVSASQDGTAAVWRVEGSGMPRVLAGHRDAVTSARFSSDGQWLVTASDDRTARVWGADGTGSPVVLGHDMPVTSARFSSDAKRVVTASEDGTARVWNADGSGQPVVLGGPGSVTVRSACFSPDGQRVATASDDRTAVVWSADGAGTPVVLKGHEELLRSVRFSADGQWLVTASDDGTARVWRADGTGSPVVLRHQGPVFSAEFSPEGQRVVTASADGTAQVWRVDGTGTPVVLNGHAGPVSSAEFSPDGQWVVTASDDKTARVWRADGTGTPVVLRGHEDAVTSARFSLDGQWVVTASYSGQTACVWKADGTGTPVVLKGGESAVVSAEFSPDGRQVVLGRGDGTVQLWPLDVSELQRRLRALNKDCLPPDVRRSYLDESEEQARQGYAACERAQGREPLAAPPPTLRLLP